MACCTCGNTQPSGLLLSLAGVQFPAQSPSGTWITSSTKDSSSTSGTKPAPMPWMRWGPGFPPESTGDSAGSTAMALNSRFLSLINPGNPCNRASGSYSGNEDIHFPIRVLPNLLRSSTPVHLRVGLVHKLLGNESSGCPTWASSFAVLMAPFIPSFAGVRMSSAPRAFSRVRRSMAHTFRHGENATVSPGCADHSQSNPSIAAGGLKNN
jgi:hypothetical protein